MHLLVLVFLHRQLAPIIGGLSPAMSLVIQVMPLPVPAAHVLDVIGQRVGELPTDPSWQVLPDEDGGVAPASIIHVRGPSTEACFLRRLRSNMMFLFVGTYWVRVASW